MLNEKKERGITSFFMKYFGYEKYFYIATITLLLAQLT